MTQEDWEYLVGVIRKDSPYIAMVIPKVEDRWAIFGLVWEWATKQEWWNQLMGRISFEYGESIVEGETTTYYINSGYINPARFPNLIVDFLREKGEKG